MASPCCPERCEPRLPTRLPACRRYDTWARCWMCIASGCLPATPFWGGLWWSATRRCTWLCRSRHSGCGAWRAQASAPAPCCGTPSSWHAQVSGRRAAVTRGLHAHRWAAPLAQVDSPACTSTGPQSGRTRCCTCFPLSRPAPPAASPCSRSFRRVREGSRRAKCWAGRPAPGWPTGPRAGCPTHSPRPPARSSCATGPEQRCRSLLLFLHLLFAFLVPLLLLVPLRRGATPAHGSLGERLDAWIERPLRCLLWSATEQDGGALPDPVPLAAAALVLRWCVVLAVLWAVCCTLEG